MPTLPPRTDKPPIRLFGVRQNNLRSIDVEFPTRKLTVVTGVSGSGKSSLAFDTLYAEGQRRYVESLSTYTRQFLEKMPKPDLDRIENVPPAIALEQKNHVINSRSTVGTQTEIVDYLRLLFARVGEQSCARCGSPVRRLDPTAIVGETLEWLPGRKALVVAPLGAPAENAAAPGKTERTKRSTRSAKRKAPAPTLLSLAQTVREQGFSRLVWMRTQGRKRSVESFELDEPGEVERLLATVPDAAISARELGIVVDRFRVAPATEVDVETRTRVRDSVEQALALARGQLALVGLADESSGRAAEWRVLDSRFACIKCGTEHPIPEPNLFSFNSPIGACLGCSGFGHTLELDEGLVVPDPTKTIKNGAIDPFSKPSFSDWQRDLFRFAERHGISIGKRYQELTAQQRTLLWKGDPEDTSFAGIEACFEDLKRYKYKLHVRVFIRRYQTQRLCSVCGGERLKPEALAVRVGDRSIAQVLALPIDAAGQWLSALVLDPTRERVARDVRAQLERRLSLLSEVGVGYLTLSRLAKTLSGGEFQRITLATQLGNGLCGTLYILDEPSIGLHPADTERLIGVLNRLRDQGNTVVVVEHDLEVMRQADWLVELGPLAGHRGGELIAQGPASALVQLPASVTGKYLSGAFEVGRSRAMRPEPKRWIRLEGCSEHNLKGIDVAFPLDRLVVVTGVSGSGKSTLVHRTLHAALARVFDRAAVSASEVGRFRKLTGAEQIRGVALLDQSPIGRSSRSNPATYLKAWDEIRRIYANQVLALRRGYTPQHFSFNVDGGRCPVCKGEGEITLDMHFMAEIRVPCEECAGLRFKKGVLEIQYRGKSVSDLLALTIDEAYELFRDHPLLVRKLGLLREVGLGYLRMGQSGATLSGGESQRLKVAATLDDKPGQGLLYIFDEPTTGLHLEDVKRLLQVIQDLVDARHSVVMIEHQLDVIAQADWVIDLGPGGGDAGGYLVAQGTPGSLTTHPHSRTGEMLTRQGYRFAERAGRDIERPTHEVHS